MEYKLWRTSLIVLICLVLPGCWSRKELTDLAIVSATGVNWKNNKWELTYQLVTPSETASGASGSGSSGGPPISVLSVQGETLQKALANNDLENTRQLHLGNNRIVVIGEEAAKQGLDSLVDAFLRNPQSRETVHLFITRDDPRIVVSQLMYLEKNTGEGIYKLIEKESRNASILPQVNMFNLATQLAGASKTAAIPEITISGQGDTSSKQALESTTTASKLKLGELAILKKSKLAGWLTQDEALGVAFIRNKVKKATFSFSCRENGSSKENKSTFEISASSTRLKLHRENDQYVVSADIKTKGTITETACELDATKKEIIRKLEQEVNAVIMGYIQQGWAATHRMKADVMQIADMYHRKYPAEWQKEKKNWDAVFAEMEFRPTLQVTIERVGLINHSFQKIIVE